MAKKDTKAPERIICDERLRHIAFIMDGNGRWAQARGLPRSAGHTAGAKTFRRLVDYAKEINLRYMTVYAFSTENWARPKAEVDAIMRLLDSYIEDAMQEILVKDVRIIFLGDREPLSDALKEKIDRLERDSAGNTLILNIALNYGGRAELVHAVNEAIRAGETPVTDEIIERHLYTAESPAPDLIVRTAGEQRLSNFLLWQAAYSEFYFTDTLWPDMTEKDVDDAVRAFYSRRRNFGGITRTGTKGSTIS